MRMAIAGYLVGQTALQGLGVLLVIVVIFLLEKAGGQISRAIEAGATLARVPYLLLVTAPQIVAYALPLALLIGVFRVFLRLREDGELVSMTNAGLRPAFFLAFALWLGVICALTSVTVSGFIEPVLRYAHRAELLLAYKESVENGMKRGQIRAVHGYVAATPNGTTSDPQAELFVVDTNPQTFQRLISADRIAMTETATSGSYNVDLVNLRIAMLDHTMPGRAWRPGKEDRLQPAAKPAAPPSIGAERYAHVVTLGELVAITPRLERDDQRTLPELLSWFTLAAEATGERLLRGTGMVLTSLLCLIAPLAALMAVCLTRSANSMIVLPAMAAGLFVINILMDALATALAAAGMHPLLPTMSIELAAIALFGNITYRLMLGGAFLKPSKSAL